MPARVAILHEAAAADYDAAFEWYLERNPQAALRFDAEFERALSVIALAPRRWVRGPSGTRRFLLRGFPYFLIYRELDGQTIEILAVAHTSRKPGYWTARV
ncbi:MAG: type II toxin-antitoxin system RelE/ParE family toxin [Terriglobales bacterium]